MKHEYKYLLVNLSVSEFNDFEPRLKSAKNQFQFKSWIQFSVEPTIFESRLKFYPRLKVFKFGLGDLRFSTETPKCLSEILSFLSENRAFIVEPKLFIGESVFIVEPQLFIGESGFIVEPQLFIGDPKVLIRNPHIFIGDLIFCMETPKLPAETLLSFISEILSFLLKILSFSSVTPICSSEIPGYS